MSKYYTVKASLHSFHDIVRNFAELHDAEAAYAEMLRDGATAVTLSEVTEEGFYYSRSLKTSGY